MVLVRDGDGEPVLSLSWVPPGLTSFHPDGPEIHYHRSIVERMFVLAGEMTLLECGGFDEEVRTPVTYRPGYFIDRRPGSVHGIDPDQPSPIGLLYLEWVIGKGSVYAELDPNDSETERRFL
jgi:hypothetical protein